MIKKDVGIWLFGEDDDDYCGGVGFGVVEDELKLKK